MKWHSDSILDGSLKNLLVPHLFPIWAPLKRDLTLLDLHRCPSSLGNLVVDYVLLLLLGHLDLPFLQQDLALHVHAEDAGLSLVQGLVMPHIYDLLLEGIFLGEEYGGLGVLNEHRGGL